MRKLRAAVVGLLLALPAALVLPGVPAGAASCLGTGIQPSVTGMTANGSPAHGPAGTIVTISGNGGFGGGGNVYFNGVAAPQVLTWTDTQIRVEAPNAATGAVTLCSTSGSLDTGTVTVPGTYYYPPSVTGYSVAAAPEGASGIRITGQSFVSGASVSVGTCAASSSFSNSTTVTFTVPTYQCTGSVVVTEPVPGSSYTQSGTGPQFTVSPRADAPSPASATYGQAVSVGGSGFGSPGSVTVGGVPAGVVSWSDTQVTFHAPDGVTGGPVTVNPVTADGSSGPSATTSSAVAVQPQIVSVGPNPAKDGESVTISGHNFGDGSTPGTVTLGGQPLNVTGWGWSQVTAAVPAGAIPGQLVLTRADNATSQSSLGLTPVISSVTPAQASPGSYVTISGSTFGQNPGSLTIGGKAAQIADWADTAIIAVVPAGATSGKLVVNSGYGTSVAWGQTFTVLAGGSSSGGSAGAGGGTYSNSGTMNVTPNYGFLPLPKAPPGVAFHLTAPSTNVKPGSVVDLTVNLAINGKAVAGATITFQVASSPGSDTSLTVPSAVTDQNGVAHVTLKTSKKPGQTIVIAHSGAFADEIRVLTLSPSASLGGVGATILRTTSTLDPHILFPFIGALVLAVLLLLGTVILQFVMHRRERVPAAAGVAPTAAAAAVEAEPVAAVAPKPRKPRARKPRPKAAPESEPVTLDLAAGAEDLADVIPITRTRPRPKS